MDVITVVMLAIVIIAVLKSFTLPLDITCKCHCTSILSVSTLLVDRQFSIIILRKSMPIFFAFLTDWALYEKRTSFVQTKKIFSLSILTQSQVSIKFSSPRILPNLFNRIFIRFVHLLSYDYGF
jgi:hypothetical protein